MIQMKFSIRIYGILINNNHQVLVSDEFIRGNFFTKFPGGGLELGEGTRDCLIREFKEETNLDVTIGEHIYTTDFYQQSAFNHQDQIISIYYYANTKEPIDLKTSNIPFDFLPHQIEDKTACAESFRWVNWEDLNESSVDLPIDKVVVKMLKKI
jgi:ADP-ribose pyrophosphatase YjhB (NUDIX family)